MTAANQPYVKPRLLDLFCGAGGAATEVRFWRYVDRRSDDECWEWTGSRRQNGYGQLNVRRYPFKAHRVSFVLAFGWEPPSVLHKCDNPPCVNPRHLFGGTQAANIADCAAKGRMARQLQPAVISTVCALAECGMSQRAITRQTGVSRRSVGRILKGEDKCRGLGCWIYSVEREELLSATTAPGSTS